MLQALGSVGRLGSFSIYLSLCYIEPCLKRDFDCGSTRLDYCKEDEAVMDKFRVEASELEKLETVVARYGLKPQQ